MDRTLHCNHYVISASLGITSKTMQNFHANVHTSSGDNVNCNESLPLRRHGQVVRDAPLPNLGDAISISLPVRHVIRLRLRHGATSYKISLAVFDSLCCFVVLGTEFINKQVVSNLCL